MMTTIEILLLIFLGGSMIFYLACAVCTYRFFAAKNADKNTVENSYPPVSILVPICGLDAGAWENWSSLCQQKYGDYEVLFGVIDNEDPAIPVLEKLVSTYPEKVHLFTNLKPRGINHKDSTLTYLLEKAKHEIIIFIDSDIRVNPDYISTVIAPLTEKEVGLVTCAFVGRKPQSVGAALASFGRCFDFIPSVLIAQIVDQGLRLAIGVTIATRKSTLADFGGLQLNRIGSDYNLGKRAAAAGYRVELSRYVLESDTGSESVWEVFGREKRWARTIRYNRGLQYYTMAFCYGMVYCIPLLLVSGFAHWAIAVCLATVVIRYTQAIIALWCMECPKLIPWLWLLPLRDFLSLIVWAMGAFGQRVYWRGRWLRVEADGIISQW